MVKLESLIASGIAPITPNKNRVEQIKIKDFFGPDFKTKNILKWDFACNMKMLFPNCSADQIFGPLRSFVCGLIWHTGNTLPTPPLDESKPQKTSQDLGVCHLLKLTFRFLLRFCNFNFIYQKTICSEQSAACRLRF